MMIVLNSNIFGQVIGRPWLGDSIQGLTNLQKLDSKAVPSEIKSIGLTYSKVVLISDQRFLNLAVNEIIVGYKSNGIISIVSIKLNYNDLLLNYLNSQFGRWKSGYKSDLGNQKNSTMDLKNLDYYIWQTENEFISLSIDRCNSIHEGLLVFKGLD